MLWHTYFHGNWNRSFFSNDLFRVRQDKSKHCYHVTPQLYQYRRWRKKLRSSVHLMNTKMQFELETCKKAFLNWYKILTVNDKGQIKMVDMDHRLWFTAWFSLNRFNICVNEIGCMRLWMEFWMGVIVAEFQFCPL